MEEALFFSLEVRYKENLSEVIIIYLKEIAVLSHKKINDSYLNALVCLWLIGTIAFHEKNELDLSLFKNTGTRGYEIRTRRETESELRKVDTKLTCITKNLREIEKVVGDEEFAYASQKCEEADILKDLLESDELKLEEINDFKKDYFSHFKE